MKTNYSLASLFQKGGGRLKKAAFITAFLLAGSNHAEAQVGLYKFTQSAGSYLSIAGGTTLGTAISNASAGNLNSNVYTTALPFGFKFDNVTYNDVHVSSNGFLTFGVSPATSNTTPISNTAVYPGAISVFGRDLCSFFDLASTTGSIVTNVEGVAPNREFVIEWKNFRPTNTTSTTGVYSMSFQIRLKETSNVIDMVYGPGSYLLGSTTYSSTAQIGLRGASNADFNNRLSSSSVAFASSTPGIENLSVQNFSTSSTATSGMPASGLTYTWSPPTCIPPSNVTISNISQTTADVNWQAPIIVPGSYELYVANNSTLPTDTTPATYSNITGLSYNIGSLTPNTDYSLYVRSVCGSADKSQWTFLKSFKTLCTPTSQVVGTGATVCVNGIATLGASGVTGATYNWYDAAVGGNMLGTGSSYSTSPLTATTNYYVSSFEGETGYAGKLTPVATSGNTSVGNYGLIFDAHKSFKLHTVDVYPMKSSATSSDNGTLTIGLYDASGAMLQSKVVNVTMTATNVGELNTVNLDFDVPAGVGYRLNISEKSSDVGGLRREITSNINFPYVLGNILTVQNSNFAGSPSTSYYYYIYNWKVSSGCESPRQLVTATVDTNCLSTSEVSAKNDVKVYPNPFVDVVNISNVDEVKSVAVSDASGRVVKMFDKVVGQLNLSQLNAGMYILNIQFKNGTNQSVKMIKK